MQIGRWMKSIAINKGLAGIHRVASWHKAEQSTRIGAEPQNMTQLG